MSLAAADLDCGHGRTRPGLMEVAEVTMLINRSTSCLAGHGRGVEWGRQSRDFEAACLDLIESGAGRPNSFLTVL